MTTCLYKCGSNAPSQQEYHVYPASTTNLQIILEKGAVCDKCNAYFAKLENYFAHHHPGSAHRLLSLQQTKKGKHPIYESEAGVATRVSNESETTDIRIPISDVSWEIKDDGTILIKCVAKAKPFDAVKISRVLGKIALEAVYAEALIPEINFDVYSEDYDPIRRYVRFLSGQPRFIWFAYKVLQEAGGTPQMGIIWDASEKAVGVVCIIRLLGIHFMFPLIPPLPAEILIPEMPEWTFVTEPGMHASKDLEAVLPLHPVIDESEAGDDA